MFSYHYHFMYVWNPFNKMAKDEYHSDDQTYLGNSDFFPFPICPAG